MSTEGAEQNIPKLDFAIDVERCEDDIRTLLKKIRPEWKENLTMQKMTGGTVNIMYRCGLKNEPLKNYVVVRVYQQPWSDVLPKDLTEDLRERMSSSQEIPNMLKVGSADLGPEIVAIFKNGICYKFIDGEVLTVHRVRTEELLPYVTRTLARINALPIDEAKSILNFSDMKQLIPIYPIPMKNQERLQRLLKFVPDRAAFDKEADHVDKRVKYANSKIIFGHGDSKGENFVWNSDNKTLKMIDLEQAGSNYQGYEIGVHFASYNDILNPSPNTYPSREFQMKWIRMYLEYYFEETGRSKEDVTEKDVERLYVQSNISAQSFRFFFGVLLVNSIEVGYVDCFEFSMNLIEDYFKYKEEVDAMTLPDEN